jgi:hypothetical protein
VKNRFQNLPFKCTLQRYPADAIPPLAMGMLPFVPSPSRLYFNFMVPPPLYTFNPVVTHRA